MAKLFVGGLPWATTSDELNKLFSNAGAVTSALVITDASGKSKGFGFVEMSDEDSQKAIEMYNGQEYGGRTLVVNEARPRADRPSRPHRSGYNNRQQYR